MKLLLLISLFYFSLLDAAAQRADLIISDGVLQTNNINRGDHLQFSFRVKNAGKSVNIVHREMLQGGSPDDKDFEAPSCH